MLDNDDMSYIKLILTSRGGNRGRAIADRIELKPRPYKTEPDYKPRECVHGIHAADYCYLCERIERNNCGNKSREIIGLQALALNESKVTDKV